MQVCEHTDGVVVWGGGVGRFVALYIGLTLHIGRVCGVAEQVAYCLF
jgi:hypothetical protein